MEADKMGQQPVKIKRDGEETGNSKEQQNLRILQQAKRNATAGYSGWSDNFKTSRDDVSFLAGNQWPDQIRKDREADQRPVITINKLPAFVDQIIGDMRQNRSSIRVHPVGTKGAQRQKVQSLMNPRTHYDLAKVIEGLIRNIEYMSNADAHYDTASQQALEGAFGWMRVSTEYSSNTSFDQDIVIKHIPDRYSVIMDPGCEEPDFADANYCFITGEMDKDEFKTRYPEAGHGSICGDEVYKVADDQVLVTEYFWREATESTVVLLSTGETDYKEKIEPILDELAADGVTILKERKIMRYKVRWAKITATDVLEGPMDWAGTTIPVVPVLGRMLRIDNKNRYMSLFTNAKPSCQLYNYWISTATEKMALAPKSPYVAEAEAIEGFEEQWETANTRNHSVLKFRRGFNKPQRERGADMPASELTMANQMASEIKNTIGIHDASLGIQSNETSGKAIMARQRQGDRATFVFSDNLARAKRRIGKIIIEIVPTYYDNERTIRMQLEDGNGDFVEINKEVVDKQTGKTFLINDIAMGNFDVVMNTGPSYQTQRQEAAEMLMMYIQQVPNAGAMLLDVVAEYQDWPGAEVIKRRFAKQLAATAPHLLTPEELEETGAGQEQEPKEPTQAEQIAMAEVQAKMADIEAKMMQAKADLASAQAAMAKAEADIAGAGADNAEAEADLQNAIVKREELEQRLAEMRAQSMDLVAQGAAINGGMNQNDLRAMIDDAIADAFAELMDQAQAAQQSLPVGNELEQQEPPIEPEMAQELPPEPGELPPTA